MKEKIPLEEYKKAYREIVKEEERRMFFIHLVVYIAINIMLIIINFIYSPGIIWFFYPLIGWGIGIVIHYLNSIRWIERRLEEREAKAEYRVRKTEKM